MGAKRPLHLTRLRNRSRIVPFVGRRNLYFHRDANIRIIESKHVGNETRLDAQYGVNLSLLISLGPCRRNGGTHVLPLIQRIIGPSNWAVGIKMFEYVKRGRVVNYVFTVRRE